MAHTRSLTRLIPTLTAPAMGQDWNSATNANPSSFNDLVNQIRGIDEAGHEIAAASGSCIGGSVRPLVGDWGNNFTHTDQTPLAIIVQIPHGMTRFSIKTHYNCFNATQQVSIYLGNQALFAASTTGERFDLTSGLLVGPNVVTSGQMETALLTVRSQKGNAGTNATNQGNRYWDGILSFSLSLYR